MMSRAHVGHRHGNFHQYYDFHPSEERIEMLPSWLPQWLSEGSIGGVLHYLDIGCNSGALTESVHRFLRAGSASVRTLGMELDEALVERAKTNYQSNLLSFVAIDIMKEEEKFGVLCSSFLQDESKTRFDLVSLFSITMWIHLNFGDEGLDRILQRVKTIARVLVVEPQPWKCYRKAARRLRSMGQPPLPFWGPDGPELSVRSAAVLEHIAAQLMTGPDRFDSRMSLGTNKWGRTVDVYYRKLRPRTAAAVAKFVE